MPENTPTIRTEPAPPYGGPALTFEPPKRMTNSELLDQVADIHDVADTGDLLAVLRELPEARRWRVDMALELARRIAEAEVLRESGQLHNSASVYRLLRLLVAAARRGIFGALYLDGKNRVIQSRVLFRGTLTSCLVDPREIARDCIRFNAGAVILYHNHPSGDPTPSHEDHAITQRTTGALELFGVRVLDHVILGGGGRYYSFADEGQI